MAVLSILILALIAVLASGQKTDCSTSELPVPASSPLRIGRGPYTYDDDADNGPSNWGNIDCPNFETCKTGQLQSPFNLELKKVFIPFTCRLSLRINESRGSTMRWTPTPQDFMMDCIDPAGCGEISYQGVEYKFLQLHMHANSEYTVDGFGSPMELHLVHRSADGRFAVLGVFITEGKENPAFDNVLRAAEQRTQLPINVSGLIGDVSIAPRPCTFQGSLTTPPCTEGIQWILSTTTSSFSKRQIDLYKLYTGNMNNNRPVQPSNDRPITCYVIDSFKPRAPVCTGKERGKKDDYDDLYEKYYDEW